MRNLSVAARSFVKGIATGQRLLFMRFVGVGVLNTGFGYAVFSALVWAHILPELALLLSTILGVLFNFATSRSLVFRTRGPNQLLPFIVVYAIIYLGNAGVLRVLLGQGISPFLAQAAILPFSVILTFLALRRFVFQVPPS